MKAAVIERRQRRESSSDCFVGAGFSWLETKLTPTPKITTTLPQQQQDQGDEGDEAVLSNTITDPKQTYDVDHEPFGLSESAKRLLRNLLKQENVSLMSSTTPMTKKQKHQTRGSNMMMMMIVDPEMSNEMKLNHAYQQEISLMGIILYVIDQYGNSNSHPSINHDVGVTPTLTTTTATTNSSSTTVPTRYILHHCAYTVIPQKTPGLLSAREMVCAALHFLCQEYNNNPPVSQVSLSTTPTTTTAASPAIVLPLIYSTSVSTDIERRSYEKAYDWDFNTLQRSSQIQILDDQFYNNVTTGTTTASILSSSSQLVVDDTNSNTNPLMWLPREMFIPDTDSLSTTVVDEQVIRHLYVQGSVPDDTMMSHSNNNSNDTSAANSINIINNNNSAGTSDPNHPAIITSTTKTIQIKRKYS